MMKDFEKMSPYQRFTRFKKKIYICQIDAVPVDTCASIIIAAAHQTAVNHR